MTEKWNNKDIMNYLENTEDLFDAFVEKLYTQHGDEEATVGFSDREQQANYYFHEKMNALDSGDHPETVTFIHDLYSFLLKHNSYENIEDFCNQLKENGYDTCSLVYTDNYNGNEYYFYSDAEEAEADFEQLKDSKEPYICNVVSEFEKEIKNTYDYSIWVCVKKEYSHPFYSFNIYDDDVLIVDGVYDLGEEQNEEVKNYLDLCKYLRNKNLYIESIDKNVDGFTRYYTITVGMCGTNKHVEVEVPMDGKAALKGYHQGVERSLVNVFKDFVDIDDLLNQFENLD